MKGVDFTQFDAYVKNFEVAKKDFMPFLKNFLLREAMRVVEKTKRRQEELHAVDTGAMVATWGIGEARRLQVGTLRVEEWDEQEEITEDTVLSVDIIGGDGKNVYVSIWNPMEYASHVEYGTPARNIQNWKPAWDWKSGARMLTISMDEVEQQMNAHFQEEFKNWVAEMGIGE